MRQRFLAVVMAAGLAMSAAGCSMLSAGAATPAPSDEAAASSVRVEDFAAPQATHLTSSGGAVSGAEESTAQAADPAVYSSEENDYVTAPSSEAEGEPSAESSDETGSSASSSGVHQMELLNFTDEFMQPKGLDGIDPMNDKVVALTFDDGPHPDNTPKLLDVLEDNDVPATFFMVGENAASYPDIVKRAYEQGCEIGTHSWDHSSNDLKWSHEEVMDQITRANDAIQEATGLRTIIDRPPEGAINAEVADNIGRAQILWDVDPNDWKPENRDPDIVYDNIINGGEIHDGSIVLSHDIRSTTVDAMDRVIKELKDQGYKFVTVTQMIQIADLRGKDVTTVFNGAPSASAASDSEGSGSEGEDSGSESSENED